MTGLSVLQTALLLGLYVLLAGLFAMAYAVGRLQRSRSVVASAAMVFAMHLAVLIIILFATPLGSGWKTMMVVASAAFAAIPPMTWRLLNMTHAEPEDSLIHARDPRT